MTNPYGPWATAIDTGGSAQLSASWRQRLAHDSGLECFATAFPCGSFSRYSMPVLTGAFTYTLFVPPC